MSLRSRGRRAGGCSPQPPCLGAMGCSPFPVLAAECRAHAAPFSRSPGGTGSPAGPGGGCLSEGGGSLRKSLLKSRRLHFKRVPVSPLCRNTHAHGSHYNPIMQQPALLASHVTLPAAQPVNVGVAHVMRQPPAAATSTRKSKQHQSAPR